MAGYKPVIEIQASPFVAAQVAEVSGKPQVFLANFTGLRSKENAVQMPEKDITISFPAKAGTRVRALPFLGKVEELPAAIKDGRITCKVPELNKGMVVWVE
jgi:hypothetical protein